jgi:hypothetical protein
MLDFTQTSPEGQTINKPWMVLIGILLINVTALLLPTDRFYYLIVMLIGLPLGAIIYGWIHQNNEVAQRFFLVNSISVFMWASLMRISFS